MEIGELSEESEKIEVKNREWGIPSGEMGKGNWEWGIRSAE